MAASMIRWRTVVCYCTAALLLLSNQVTKVSSQDNAVFTIPITKLAQDLSKEFSNILTQNLGVDALEQAFQGSDVFYRQMARNDIVTAEIDNARLPELYNRTIQLTDEALAQTTTHMYSEELIRECCEITAPTLGPCCHRCQSQSESDRNYLIKVAGVLSNGSTFLFNDFNSIQVRFEVGHQSGALIEMPGINIGLLKDCTTRNSLTEDWYESTINATGVVAQSVRSTDGGFFLSIAMASNGMVARALVKMTDIFSGLVELLHRRPSSYWFVLNSEEDIFYYPRLPVHANVPIRQLEGELQNRGILVDMIRSVSNQTTITKTYLLPNGPSVTYGYVERSIMANIIFQPILRNSAISLSICVILAEEDRNSATVRSTNPQDIIGTNTRLEPFYHCSFATGATNHNQCSYYCQSASRDALSVYLTDPSNPPPNGDSVDLSTMINLYLENGMNKPDWIQEGVATEAARASVSLNPVWTSQPNSGINAAVSWRYAAFPSGLLLNHPAVKIDPNLEFNDLPWYSRALAHPGLMTLSPAIADPRQTGLIYSISKALYIPNGNTATVGGPVLSVVAGDISLTSLHVAINSMEPLCSQRYYSCFLIDDAGMIIYHPSYLTNIPSKVPNHITTFHPTLYNHLVSPKDRILKKDRCNDYYNSAVNISERSFSMFQLGFSDVDTNNNSGNCDKYQFTRIPDTNVFLVIEHSPDCIPIVFCTCRQHESSLQSCVSCPNNNPISCDCPCTCHLNQNTAVSSVRPCPIGPTEQPPNYNFRTNAPSGLSQCYSQECSGIKDQNTCNTSRECTWCFGQCTRLADCCEDSQTNLLPNCISSVCRDTGAVNDDDVSSGAIAGAVVGVIFVILVIGCLILVLVWYNFIRKEDPNAPKQENEFDFSKSRSSSDTQSQEPLSKKAANKTDSRVEERDSNGANIVTPDTIQLSNPLYANNTTSNNNTEQPPPAPMPETDL